MADMKAELNAQALQAYIRCALWSTLDESTEDGGVPLDENYGEDDLAPETRQEMMDDLGEFLWYITQEQLDAYLEKFPPGYLGHDFWLTREGHGTGFWDRGLGELGDALTEAANIWGPYNLYVGDDGKIYGG